jgi:hypothetical protein
MAPRPKKVITELGNPQPKKHVVRYDGDDPDGALTTVYISKEAIEELGNPDAIKVTIEAA